MNEINPILRQLSIDMIIDAHNPIVEHFSVLWESLNVRQIKAYYQHTDEFVYYKQIDGVNQWIFYRNDANQRFWCNFENYWSIIAFAFKMEHDQIQSLTKFMMEHYFNTPEFAKPNFLVSDSMKLSIELAMPDTTLSNSFIKLNDLLNNAKYDDGNILVWRSSPS